MGDMEKGERTEGGLAKEEEKIDEGKKEEWKLEKGRQRKKYKKYSV